MVVWQKFATTRKYVMLLLQDFPILLLLHVSQTQAGTEKKCTSWFSYKNWSLLKDAPLTLYKWQLCSLCFSSYIFMVVKCFRCVVWLS